MHVTLNSGGRSPKQANIPTSTSQPKPVSDIGQNSGTSFPSQTRGRKRERVDQGVDPAKRERSSRSDEGDSGQCKTESSLKYEIARITEKGGVMDVEGVEKLVQLMQPDRMDRKIDLVSRALLVSVIASGDNVDCLNRFVQLRGLPVLDEWLQDIHKGKVNDGNLKDGDKSVEEFLLVLLCALDKLPVNLHALQTCNIGRSVNHLRSHKNVEIQRKARTLVDTWKKRVEAEMMSADAKSDSTQAVASWPSKSRFSESSHGGSRTLSGSDVATKSLITQNSPSKGTSVRSSHAESGTKYAASSPGPVKPASPLASGKESQPRTSMGATADGPQNREDRNNSSNQSHNYGHSSSSKEDVKSSTSGSATINKISSSTRNRRTSGFPGTSATGSQKETDSSRSSSGQKSTALEKLQSAFTCERVVEGPISDGNSHKLIVKIPNRVRSPAQVASGGSLEDPAVTSSQASSSMLKHEQSDDVLKENSDTCQCNAASDINTWQSNAQKVVLAGSEGAGSHAFFSDKEQSIMTEDSKRKIEGPKTSQLKLPRLHAASFSPMNALIESCVKYSEATSSLSLVDDVGMNLLASVATGEISKSDVVSPSYSTERSTPAIEELCHNDEARSKSSPVDCAPCDDKKHAVLEGCSSSYNGLHLSKHASPDLSGERKCTPSRSSGDVSIGEDTKCFGFSSTQLASNPEWEVNEKPNREAVNFSSALPVSMEKVKDGESDKGINDEKTASCNHISDSISSGTDVMGTKVGGSTGVLSIDECKTMVEADKSTPLDDRDKFVNEGLNRTSSLQQNLTEATAKSEFGERDSNEKMSEIECGQKSVSEAGDAVRLGKPIDTDAKSCSSKSSQHFGNEMDRDAVGENRGAAVLCPISHDLNSHLEGANVESQEISEHISPSERRYPVSVNHEGQKKTDLAGLESACVQSDGANKCASHPASAAPEATDPAAKMKFDLNEGFIADDGKFAESTTNPSSTSLTVHMINKLPFSMNSITSGHSSSVTVAAAAKGPFVPPEDLLRGKVELGWKGSAATSAFRPAEPRKAFEMPPCPTNLSCPNASTSKHERISLDIDLNVPDERVLEEMASRGSALAVDSTTDSANNCTAMLSKPFDSLPVHDSGFLDLDLNRADETNDVALCSTSSNCNGEDTFMHLKSNSGFHARRDFDLNNGPVVDDASADQSSFKQLAKGGTAPQLPSAGITMNSPGMGSFTSWFPPGSTYSMVTIPSLLPDRVEQPFPVFPPAANQRMYGSAGVAPFNPDMYRGSVLSSSPAVSFPSSPFQFSVFPFGATYALPSTTFPVGATSYSDTSSGARLFAPPVNSQHLGQVGSFATQFQRPYMVSLPDISNNGGLDSNRMLGRQGLDLNAGPGTVESDIREDLMPLSSGQHSVAISQALSEEQARIFSVTGSILKRKEPEGSWESQTFRNR